MQLSLQKGSLDLNLGVFRTADGDRPLTAMETKLLQYLAAQRRPVPQEELLHHVWEYSSKVVSRTVRVTVNRLRAKIEADPREPAHLLTVKGEGYELVAERLNPSVLPDDLFGRRDALGILRDAVDAGRRVVTVIGTAGIGKSHLARAHALLSSGAIVVDLSASLHPWATTAAALGLNPSDDTRDAVLRCRPYGTVVLDNVDTCIEGVRELVAAWDVPLVVTSRQALGLRDEAVLELGPLDAESTEALFRHIWSAKRLGSQPEDLGRILPLLEGNPLIVELACAWVGTLSVDEVGDRLEQGLGWLEDPDGDRDPRHRSVRHAVAVSWGLLEEQDRDLLAQITVFAGGFTLPDAEAVLQTDGSVIAGLKRLRDRSTIDRREDRFHVSRPVLELAREYRPTGVDGRHARAFLAKVLAADLTGPGQPEGLRRLDAERSNLEAAFRWARSNDSELTSELARSLLPLYSYLGPLQTWVELLERAPNLPTVLVSRAGATRLTGHSELALALAERAVEQERSFETLEELGRNLALSGRTEEARASFEEAVDYARDSGKTWAIGRALRNMATVMRFAGQGAEALAMFQEALAAARKAGDPAEIGLVTSDLAEQLSEEGDLQGALRLFDGAPAGMPPGVRAIFHLRRGNALVVADRLAEALVDYDIAYDISAATGARRTECGALYGRVLVELDMGLPGVIETIQQLLTTARESHNPYIESATLRALGDALLELEDFDGSRKAHDQALAIDEALGVGMYATYARYAAGTSAVLRGELERGRQLLEQCLADNASGRTAMLCRAVLKLVDPDRLDTAAEAPWVQALHDIGGALHRDEPLPASVHDAATDNLLVRNAVAFYERRLGSPPSDND